MAAGGTVHRDAIGSREAPMTNANLETKFVGLAEGILATEQIQELIDLCLGVKKLPNAAAIANAGHYHLISEAD